MGFISVYPSVMLNPLTALVNLRNNLNNSSSNLHSPEDSALVVQLRPLSHLSLARLLALALARRLAPALNSLHLLVSEGLEDSANSSSNSNLANLVSLVSKHSSQRKQVVYSEVKHQLHLQLALVLEAWDSHRRRRSSLIRARPPTLA